MAAAFAVLTTPVAAQVVQTAPPPGFADLETAQPAVVDVWFDNVPVGMAEALVRPGFIRFDDPQAVTALLPGTVDRDAVAAALAGELAAHAEKVCTDVPDPACGVLDPTVAGVIFDVTSFRADVFVAPPYRDAANARAVYLDVPTWAPSAVQSFSVAASLVSDEDPTGVVGARSLLASGPMRLVGDYGYDREGGYFTDRLAVQGDHRDWRMEIGLDRAAPVPILGERRFLGARIATTLDTRLDRDSIRGSPLVVTLARRSQVEVLRDGRLISVQSLPAGTQALDTAALPSGSYDVTLRILSATGVREEQRFFVKSDVLPPSGATQMVFEGGVFAEDTQAAWPEIGDTPFVHAGIRHRVLEPLGLALDVATTAEETAASVASFASWRGQEAALDGFIATTGGYGVGVAVRGSYGTFTYGVGLRRAFGNPEGGVVEPGDPDDPLDDVFIADDALDSLTAFANDTTQADASIGWRIGRGPRIGLRGFWREDAELGTTYSFGPNLFWPLGRWGDVQLDLLADAAKTDAETFVLARLRLAFDAYPWRLEGSGGFRHTQEGSEADGASGSLGASRTWRTGSLGQAQASVFADYDPEATSVGGGLTARGGWGRLQVDGEHDIEAGQNRLAVTAFSSIVANPRGIGIGGATAQDSALIVAADGSGDAVFDVLIDERVRGRVRAGEQTVITLRPYRRYRVRLRQVEGPVVGYAGTVRERTLYPGTVVTERWDVAPLVSVFGRLVSEDGRPLADATLLLDPPYGTDSAGYFQADLSAGRPRIEASTAAFRCRLSLPELEPTSRYQRLGDVPCLISDGARSASR